MASGFTRPVEMSRKSVMEIANKARSGGATINDYAKSTMTKKNSVQPALSGKLRKS
jgi:hypothetical protein